MQLSLIVQFIYFSLIECFLRIVNISLKVHGINPGAYFTPKSVQVFPEQVCPQATMVELIESTILLQMMVFISDLQIFSEVKGDCITFSNLNRKFVKLIYGEFMPLLSRALTAFVSIHWIVCYVPSQAGSSSKCKRGRTLTNTFAFS